MELITPPGHDRGGDSEYVGLRRHLQPVVTTWLTGLLAVLPLVLTLVLLGWAVGIVNRFLGPSSLFGRSFTVFGEWFEANPIVAWLLGTLLTLGLIYLLGLLVRSRLTAPFKTLVGNTMRRIPLVGSVYALAERFVSVIGDRQHADIAAMSPVWCFFGGDGVAVLGLLPNPEPIEIDGRLHLTVLVPTAPIPVGGGLLYVPIDWVKPAEIGIDTLTSVYLSMGITPPRPGAAASARGKIEVPVGE
ncbi:hypothetical protein GCM10007164_12830 [Luteimonas padinae]|uniref:DUF502 domain-containing protein n=1 Tax=Luteimonas padinae TaxID=1714359 RepID=A0ABV6SUZ7_9GAMM|nr:DUF502 domain-containing protein [Luteimonas padinae]GHD69493.1 hypothetical protein GCM10007164_12830 [Luteimonas padinae]